MVKARSRWQCVALLLAPAILAGGCGKGAAAPGAGGGAAGGPPGKRAFRVVGAPVRTDRVVYALDAVGGLEAEEELQIPARVAGVVDTVRFREGDQVKAGDVMVEIDPVRYALTVQRTKAALERANADVREAEGKANAAGDKSTADLKEAEDALAKRLHMREQDAGWVSEEELTTYRTRVDRAKAAVAEARTMAGAEVDKLRAAAGEARALLAIAEQDAKDAVIRAPISGVINDRKVMPGQQLAVGAAIATIVNLQSIRLRFQVNEAEAGAITGVPRIHFTVRPAPGREFAATLYHVGQVADPSSRMVDCLAHVPPGGEADLKPGYFAKVHVILEARPEAIVVPESAVLPTDRGFVVFVVESGVAHRRELKLGLHTEEGAVEVLSGLNQGEMLVIRGASILTEGRAVEVVSPEDDAKGR